VDPFDPATGNPITYLSFSIDSTGRAIFKCNQAFLNQFYIEINRDFSDMIDIPYLLWAGTNPLGQLVTQDNPPGTDMITLDLYGDEIFQYTIQSTTPGGLPISFRSNRSIFLADRRQTLVVEISFPFSKTIHSLDGKYIERYRLCEFPIDNYVEIHASAESLNGQVIEKIKLRDTLQGGLIDFTKGYPETHIIHFMNGNLYTANTRIYVVYKDFVGTYIEKPFDIDGFYDLEILFIKKVKQDVGRKPISSTDVGELRS
jgi:hypothetical protein